MIANKEKDINLTKLSLLELRDLLERENNLINNKKLLNKLPDKGASVVKFSEKIQQEITHRELLFNIEQSLENLKLDDVSTNDKHSQKVFTYEKPEKERFKPSSTLHKKFEPKPGSDVSKLIEDAKYFNKPTKLLKLPESMTILLQQEERVKEEQIKSKYEREMEKLKEIGEDEDGNDENEGSGESEHSDNDSEEEK